MTLVITAAGPSSFNQGSGCYYSSFSILFPMDDWKLANCSEIALIPIICSNSNDIGMNGHIKWIIHNMTEDALADPEFTQGSRTDNELMSLPVDAAPS